MKRSLTFLFRLFVFLMLGITTSSFARASLRFEAEDVTQPTDAWEENQFSETKWNLWSTDVDAEQKWSEGIVLQSPRVLQDRQHPEDGAPPLYTLVQDLPAGKYDVEIGGVGRPMAISLDGQTWQRIDGGSRYLGLFDIQDGRFELWVDDRYASTTNPGSCYYDYLEFTPLPSPTRKPQVTGFAQTRVQEALGRGLIALPMEGGRTYLGWRLLSDDPPGLAFNVYRQAQKETVKLNEHPITQTTDFVDEQPVPGFESRYFVRPVHDGTEGLPSDSVLYVPAQESQPYISLPLEGDHTFQKCGIADLDGDGEFDFVIKQPNKNVDPYVKYWKPSPSTYKVEAYLSDGTFLWRRDLGWAIEQGIWYSPMIVYDLDGDGRAEVCLKMGEGDPRDSEGRVQSGPEYLAILDGLTGEVLAQTDWPKREDLPSYNYASRNQICIAYLDGKTPCLISVRGTYNVIQARAYQFHRGQLEELWRWSDSEEGRRYRGQGAHSMHAVDVDEDGRDEVFLGSAVLDDNGCGLWSTGLGHPDHHYVGDIDPARPGLEVYYGIETRRNQNGCCLVDARTGQILWGLDTPTRHVHSRGMCADIDPDSLGYEAYSSDTDAQKRSDRRWLLNAQGQVLRRDLDWGFGPFVVLWDADPYHEIIRGRRIVDYPSGQHKVRLEGSVVGIADVLGDWREEILVSRPGELRIYTTTLPARDRRVCLMQDPLYRLDVAIQAMGYTQSPMSLKQPGAE